MARIYDPAQLTHPQLREFAVVAAWIATLAESANDLEDLLVDVPPTGGSYPISPRPSRRNEIAAPSLGWAVLRLPREWRAYVF